MKTSISFRLGLLTTCASLTLLACGSDSKDGAAGDGGGDPTASGSGGSDDPGAGGGSAAGGRSGAGGGSASGGRSGAGGSDPGDSGAGGTDPGDSGSGGSQQSSGGSQQSSGGSGGGGGPVVAGWFCMQVGEACSCIPATGVAPQNACTQPVQPCCFTFDGNCQCQATTQISCPQWISAIQGTAVSTCPPAP